MKRLPLLLTLLALVFLAVSATYWGMQLYKPQQRPLAKAPAQNLYEPSPESAATLFGGQPVTAVASNYQLTGVVAAGRDGVAILVSDGQPPKAVKVGRELAPGVSISEVHPRYVMLSEGGVMRRIDLATDTRPAAPMAGGPAAALPPPPPPPTVAPAGALPTGEPQPMPGAVQGAQVQLNAPVQPNQPPPGEVNPVVPQGQEPPPEGPPSDMQPPPVQMAQPTRSMGSPVNDQPVSQ